MPRLRSLKSRSLRAGRRTIEEQNFPKCDGKKDFLTQEYIPEEYAFRLGKTCFDIRSLLEYIEDNNRNHVVSVNPFNRQEFTEKDYEKMNKKLQKIGLYGHEVRERIKPFHPKAEELFDKVWNVIVKHDFAEPKSSHGYKMEHADWEHEGRPNAKKFLIKLCDPDEITVPKYRLRVDELDHSPRKSWYTANSAKKCMKDVNDIHYGVSSPRSARKLID